jgi:hypothetical protein
VWPGPIMTLWVRRYPLCHHEDLFFMFHTMRCCSLQLLFMLPVRVRAAELICKNLCNGFGLRGAGGQCYAYGVYPAASYFSTVLPSSPDYDDDNADGDGDDNRSLVLPQHLSH